MRAIVALTAFFTTTACVPFPHLRTVTAPQQGVLHIRGAPAASVKVFQSFGRWDRQCEQSARETRTDENGAFSFTAHRPFFTYISIGDDYHWSFICAEHAGARKWLTFSSTIHETSDEPQRYRCDLGQQIRDDFPSGTRTDLPVLRCTYETR